MYRCLIVHMYSHSLSHILSSLSLPLLLHLYSSIVVFIYSLYRMVWQLWRWLEPVLIKTGMKMRSMTVMMTKDGMKSTVCSSTKLSMTMMVLLICWVGTLQNLLFYPVILWVELSLPLVTSDAVFCFNCIGTGQHSRPTGHRHWSGQHSRPTGHHHWSGQHYYSTGHANLWSEKTKKRSISG